MSLGGLGEIERADRTAMLPAIKQIADDAPAYLRAKISEPEWREWWLAAFAARLRRAERDAVRLYPELLRMVGANDAVLDVALRALGVSLEAAKLAVGAYREVEHLRTPEEMADYGLAQLRAYWEPRGKRVVLLDGLEPGGAGVTSGAAPDAATIPGSLNGGTDANDEPR